MLVLPGKGILAADESTPTITKRFNSVEISCTEEMRSAYREMLFTTDGLGEFISGIILFDETFRQASSEGVGFPELIRQKGMIPGIKVDKGAKPMAGHAGEKITEGLDGLRGRLDEYRELGAQFTKWRAVISIGEGLPTVACMRANAHALARFAALSQEAGLVPVVEPEVLMEGSHSIEHCECVTELTLKTVFDELFEQRVLLEGMLLKSSMVVSGRGHKRTAPPEEVAERTIRCLRRTVPAAVPGVVFLSGGQTDVEATRNLNEMNKLTPQPWELSFSFGRALQAPALKLWHGKEDNRAAVQEALYHRARCNNLARHGMYLQEMEEEPVAVFS